MNDAIKPPPRNRLDDSALDQLFRTARTFSSWEPRPVAAETLHALAQLLKMGPTSANCSPARIVFVTSAAGKERLKPCLAPGNVDKTMTAPCTALIGYDLEFYEKLPMLFPHADARSWFISDPANVEPTAFRNSSLQGAYLIMAARALGLDCGPMSGFDEKKLAAEFFPGGKIKPNFICNIGYGSPEKLFPRSPRFKFEEFCSIV